MSSGRDDVWSIRRVLGWTAPHFEKHGVDSPRLTAEVLLAFVLECDRVRLYVDLDRPLSKTELQAFRQLIERRVSGEPTAYITCTKEFYNRRFHVDARVLIPRPETEMLIELALEHLPKEAPSRVLDVCTGSGCIGVTVAAERPQASVWAVDVSKDAIDVARLNAEKLGVGGRVTFFEGDLFAPLPESGPFDAVISNPPYVARETIPTLSKEVQKEPSLALDGGADGLSFYRRLIPEARRHVKPQGLLALEIGEEQGPAVLQLLHEAGYHNARIVKDFARLDRFALGFCP